MDTMQLLRLQPTMQMLAEAFDSAGWIYQMAAPNRERSYRGVRVFSGQRKLEADLVYILQDRECDFPTDEYSYLCTTPVNGKANHVYCPQKSVDEILELLMDTFAQYQQWETQINELVLSNASLSDLCDLGRRLIGNPFCIHDDWFIIIAMSDDLPQVMPPENVAASVKGFIPRKFIDSFKYDTDYQQSYAHKKAELWFSEHQPESNRCMYVNLWEGDLYRGRMLIIESFQQFKASHFLIAECLAQRAMLILQQRRNSERWEYHSMDDIAYGLLEGKPLSPSDIMLLLETLGWKKTDQYLCIRIQNQQQDTTAVLEHVLHSDLFRLFTHSYIMFVEHQQCMILNLTKESISASQARHRLSALCQDYCLYAGVSSPVWGVEELKHAFRQTDIALEQAFYLHNERWVIPFSACALDYMLRNIRTDLLPGHLVSPELLALLDYDRQNGTEYFITLRTFLLNERDIPKSSEALIIHRTTLIYRLKKIQSVTSINLDDPDQRLYLQLSLKLLEQMNFSKYE